MPYEIQALIDKPLLLALVLAVGAVCGIAAERFGNHLTRIERRAYWRGRNARRGRPGSAPVVPLKAAPERSTTVTAAEQLRVVMEAGFERRPLLNKPERRLLTHIDKALADYAPGWRAMGQVSVGEIVSSEDKEAFWAVNAKRVDLLIVDADCTPLHAIEFQGTGHHLSSETAARDAVKKEALRRAGIGYAEVVSGNTPAEVREMVRKWAAAAGVREREGDDPRI